MFYTEQSKSMKKHAPQVKYLLHNGCSDLHALLSFNCSSTFYIWFAQLGTRKLQSVNSKLHFPQ